MALWLSFLEAMSPFPLARRRATTTKLCSILPLGWPLDTRWKISLFSQKEMLRQSITACFSIFDYTRIFLKLDGTFFWQDYIIIDKNSLVKWKLWLVSGWIKRIEQWSDIWYIFVMKIFDYFICVSCYFDTQHRNRTKENQNSSTSFLL